MKEFGNQYFAKVAYINFDNNHRMQELFQADYDIKRLITAFQIKTGVVITPHDTLLIFDEIQEAPGAVTSLKYFCEKAPEYFRAPLLITF